MAQQLSKSMFTAFLTLVHTASVFLLFLAWYIFSRLEGAL